MRRASRSAEGSFRRSGFATRAAVVRVASNAPGSDWATTAGEQLGEDRTVVCIEHERLRERVAHAVTVEDHEVVAQELEAPLADEVLNRGRLAHSAGRHENGPAVPGYAGTVHERRSRIDERQLQGPHQPLDRRSIRRQTKFARTGVYSYPVVCVGQGALSDVDTRPERTQPVQVEVLHTSDANACARLCPGLRADSHDVRTERVSDIPRKTSIGLHDQLDQTPEVAAHPTWLGPCALGTRR